MFVLFHVDWVVILICCYWNVPKWNVCTGQRVTVLAGNSREEWWVRTHTLPSIQEMWVWQHKRLVYQQLKHSSSSGACSSVKLTPWHIYVRYVSSHRSFLYWNWWKFVWFSRILATRSNSWNLHLLPYSASKDTAINSSSLECRIRRFPNVVTVATMNSSVVHKFSNFLRFFSQLCSIQHNFLLQIIMRMSHCLVLAQRSTVRPVLGQKNSESSASTSTSILVIISSATNQVSETIQHRRDYAWSDVEFSLETNRYLSECTPPAPSVSFYSYNSSLMLRRS